MAQAATTQAPICHWTAKRSGPHMTVTGKQFIAQDWVLVKVACRTIEVIDGILLAEGTDGQIFNLRVSQS